MNLGRLFTHDFSISPSDNNGIIVKIGCARLCYSSSSEFLRALEEFFKDPEKWEKEYNSNRGPTAEAVNPGQYTCEPTTQPSLY